MGRASRLVFLCALCSAPVFGQQDRPVTGQRLSNQPASISNNFDWPAGNSSLAAPAESSAVTGGPVETTPAIRPFAAPPERAVPTRKTPIGRSSDVNQTSSSGTAVEDRERPADLLRRGAWTSGIAVVLLAVVGTVVVVSLKKRGPQLAGGLPREVCDILGRKRLDPRTNLCLVRLGNRILVLGMSGETVSTLTEITDPLEIDQIAGLCRLRDPGKLPSFGSLLGRAMTGDQRTSTPKTEARRRGNDRPGGERGRASQSADLPGLRGLKPGEALDLTKP